MNNEQSTMNNEIKRIIEFIQTTLGRTHFSAVVIGLSGGLDSSVVTSLAVQALGADHVYPVLLPYGPLGIEGVLDAMELIQQIGIPLSHVARIDIKPFVDAIAQSSGPSDPVRRGNIMARVRMTILFDHAKKHGSLVMGTENKSEQRLGYFTRFGDSASDIEPIAHLYKTQVQELGRTLAIPEKIINKPPSANLVPMQTDEGDFGFSYIDADKVLVLYGDQHKSREEIVKEMGSDKASIVAAVIARVEQNAFKHETPYHL